MTIPFTLNCNGKLIRLDTPKVMAIINLTPDSFYQGNRFFDPEVAISQIKKAVADGADMIDLGACSTRPGADIISEDEEWNRLEPVLKLTRKLFPEMIISIDTFRSSIAHKAVKLYAAEIINDISGGSLDNKMFETIGKLKVPYILMHMRGTPQTMQNQTQYNDLMKEVLFFFSGAVKSLTESGAHDIIIDPGFGFAKDLDQNYELLARLEELKILEKPILCGLSRKSMIYKLLGSSPSEALNGTTVLNTLALQKGASILRVHDVKEAVETLKIFNQLNRFN